eukprot:Sspe_Gene.34224::Locus_16653_Transcript_1_1_Confidence_1.000_Length_1323::g.34224::m.34224
MLSHHMMAYGAKCTGLRELEMLMDAGKQPTGGQIPAFQVVVVVGTSHLRSRRQASGSTIPRPPVLGSPSSSHLSPPCALLLVRKSVSSLIEASLKYIAT